MNSRLKEICDKYINMREEDELDKMATKPFAEYLMEQLDDNGRLLKTHKAVYVTMSVVTVDTYRRDNQNNPFAKYGVVGYIERALSYHDLNAITWKYVNDYKAIEFKLDLTKMEE